MGEPAKVETVGLSPGIGTVRLFGAVERIASILQSFTCVAGCEYGWKVGFSGSAFPHAIQVKPAPGIPCSA